MKKMLGLVVALSLTLGGCTYLQKITEAYNTATGVTVNPTAVYVARSTFGAVEATATNYLTLKACTDTSGPVCRSKSATSLLVPAILAGRQARKDLMAIQTKYPGQLGAPGLMEAYTDLQNATASLQAIITKYKIRTAQ